MWDLSCPDWADRLREGRSLVPDLPLIMSEAEMGLSIFDELRLPDVVGQPRLGDAAGQWFRDIVRASFGSWDPVKNVRYIRDIFALAPKGSSKTSYGAGLMIDTMVMNRRPRAEALFIGPTQAVSDRAYEQAVGMIDSDPDLKKRFHPRDHLKTIEDYVTKSEMKVKTFDLNILTGSILIFVLLDEIHLLGRNAHTTKVLRQIRGGIDKTPEGLLLMTTTQSDDIPTGAFKDELRHARRVRDGEFRGKVIRPLLPILYEFPKEIATDQEKWQDPTNWPMVMPNLGRPITIDTLVADWQSEKEKGEHAIRIWASQHLNIEIGVGMGADAWAGAEFWHRRADQTLTLEELIRRCDVATIGVDGGGLDDLLGLCVIGREKETRRWLVWCKAWAHEIVLQRRKEIASRLTEFANAGTLGLVDDESADDIEELADIIEQVRDAGLLPEKCAIGADPAGVTEIVDELCRRGFTVGTEQEFGDIYSVSQGYKLQPAIKSAEKRLAQGTLIHDGSPLMAWCVGNARAEMKGNGIMITKQAAGSGKIDPVMAMFNAVTLMSLNPEAAGHSVYEERDLRFA